MRTRRPRTRFIFGPSPRLRGTSLVVLAAVLVTAAFIGAVAPRSAHADPGDLTGAIPRAGTLGLVTWGGGSSDQLGQITAANGCQLRSLWATKPGGGLIGLINSAPAFVNAPFYAVYPDGTFGELTPLIVVCAPPSSPPPGTTPTPVPPTADAQLSTAEALMVGLVNQERVAAGLPALVTDLDMVPVARAHSQDMSARDFFSHTNPDGLDPFDRMRAAGINYSWAGENLARASSVQRAHDLLMDSPGHRANILGEHYTHIAIGMYESDARGIYITQLFRSK